MVTECPGGETMWEFTMLIEKAIDNPGCIKVSLSCRIVAEIMSVGGTEGGMGAD